MLISPATAYACNLGITAGALVALLLGFLWGWFVNDLLRRPSRWKYAYTTRRARKSSRSRKSAEQEEE